MEGYDKDKLSKIFLNNEVLKIWLSIETSIFNMLLV